MILAKATWTEVEALDREQVVVVPVGGTEQHGASLPLGTAWLFAEAVAHGLHEGAGDAVLVAPTLPYGVSGADKTFAGTIDLGYEAFAATLRAVVVSLARHRFRRFLFVLGGAGDMASAVKIALRGIKDAHPNVQLAVFRASGFQAGWEAALASLDPGLVRWDSVMNRPTMSLDAADRFAANFVTDSDEADGLPPALTAPPDAEAGRRSLQAKVEEAVELVNLMRRDRVYVEDTS